jgi:hypothetical protein
VLFHRAAVRKNQFREQQSMYSLNQNGLKPVFVDIGCDPAQDCLVSMNPRAFDSPRAIQTRQDRPSTTAGINENNIYSNPGLANYRAGPMQMYAPYGTQLNAVYNLNNAQVTYYIDPEVQPPYYAPAYNLPFKSELVNYIDPMDSWKPHYTHETTAEGVVGFSCLSFINDTAMHREDLMARQRAKFNQQRSDPLFN